VPVLKYYNSSTSQWEEAFVGATGQTGVAGPTGATGPAGAAGADGTDGIAGVTGATGPQGAAGADGADGSDGAAGPTGATGPQGIAGADGAAGATGATGPTSNAVKIDALTFNGSTASFALQYSGSAVYPAGAAALIVSLDGVIQEPDVDYTVSSSTITFTTAPAAGTDFFGVSLNGISAPVSAGGGGGSVNSYGSVLLFG